MLMGFSIGTWMLLIVTVCFSGSSLLVWYAARNSGQFEDVEGVKYRMLEEESLVDVPLNVKK
ncbi:cbb3-type cytochrome oxidase assembly protein [Aneurinibacillus tyrosinisolvens]|jgi:hypothetical protein|uniref:cbb3-type cytochrome oxidase assembly protein n=1 Tax=Aneurinibacillus tyrosinisolvens TaxID=1443435 RepID=UPI00063F147A|nr:cbb3-type cytochrome oxidase assembly protein [Aneurinibacillus tyrosinisolvens]